MIFGLIWWIVVGLIAGWLAGKVMKGRGYGIAMDIAIGMVGAVIGGFLIRGLGGLVMGGLLGSIVVAFVGSVILIWLSRLLKKA